MNRQKAKNKQSAKDSLLAWSDHARDDYLYWQQSDIKMYVVACRYHYEG